MHKRRTDRRSSMHSAQKEDLTGNLVDLLPRSIRILHSSMFLSLPGRRQLGAHGIGFYRITCVRSTKTTSTFAILNSAGHAWTRGIRASEATD
jgi:hypothetical protein